MSLKFVFVLLYGVVNKVFNSSLFVLHSSLL